MAVVCSFFNIAKLALLKQNRYQKKNRLRPFLKSRVFLKFFALMILACSLTGCHFLLRGQASKLPDVYHSMKLTTVSPPPHLTSIVKQQLLRNGVDLGTRAPYRLTLHQEVIQKNILSISSGSSSRQYQLIYKLYFSFEQMKGATLIDNQPVLVTRFLTINNDRILGSHDEEEHIIDDMRLDASLQIIRRISALPPLTKRKS